MLVWNGINTCQFIKSKPDIPPWLKGHMQISLRALAKQLIEKQSKSKNLSIVFVNEHRTIITCSKCNVRIKIIRNRTIHCSACKTWWNRDVNKGSNILQLGLVKTGLIKKEFLLHWDTFNAHLWWEVCALDFYPRAMLEKVYIVSITDSTFR